MPQVVVRIREGLALGLCVLAAGCGLVDGGLGGCTTNFRYGLAVYVKDSSTGAWAASGARLLTYIQNTPVDTANTFPSAFPAGQSALDSMPLLGAGERAGIYRVTVRKPGYADWIGAAVVTDDKCHVRRTSITARLRPQ